MSRLFFRCLLAFFVCISTPLDSLSASFSLLPIFAFLVQCTLSIKVLAPTEIDNLPTLARINLFREEVGLPLIENIPNALQLARPVDIALSDVTPVRISELKYVIGWHKRAHFYLEVEAARCKDILLNRRQVLLEKPDHGVVSHPPSGNTGNQIHKDDCDRLATKSLLKENDSPSISVITINQRKRKNHKRKSKVVANGALSQDSSGSAEGDDSVKEPTKDLISPNLLPVPITSTESGSSSHSPILRARPINSRERGLLDSLYEMLVECANRTDSRALRAVKSKAPTLCSNGETLVGQANQRRRERESRLSITIPSLSLHSLSLEVSSPRPSFETPKNRIEDEELPPSAPPALLHPQPKTSTYSDSTFTNP
ncbi:hypothetical protein ACN38_g10748 [Penicillium nordicum]|uniref:Uncharacterized protein n=1 Tax=Penicillium nordicum TaxID=229535 RepID=A0A0M9WBE7_9EURO|nr:hypothetical protein ACN38_g10748 [Penicillium nordicum]